MTSAFKIHDTVLEVSSEAKVLLPTMPMIRNENKLFSELVLCILSSQEKYEVALAVMKSLKCADTLRKPNSRSDFASLKRQIRNVLKHPVNFISNSSPHSRRLRFNVKKGEYIIRTMENIYFNNLTIRRILSEDPCVQNTRRRLIELSVGLGPKQASMFLRNVGYYGEFAVLDKHVIDFMRIMGLTQTSQNSFSTMSSYQVIESILKSYADTYAVNLIHLDLAIWTTMRTLNKYPS